MPVTIAISTQTATKFASQCEPGSCQRSLYRKKAMMIAAITTRYATASNVTKLSCTLFGTGLVAT